MRKLSFLFLFLTLLASETLGANHENIKALSSSAVIFVKAGATGAANGTTWTNAFANLQDALDVAVKGDIIWVAKGTYYPSKEFNLAGITGTRTQTFNISDSIRVYGGFSGTENSVGYDLSTRDFQMNETKLSGNIGSPTDSTDNCYHVITTEFVTAFTTVDGFTIRDGSAPSGGFDANGGGWINQGESWYSNPTIRNCAFTNNAANSGAGFSSFGLFSGETNPLFENCTFYKNRATSKGGAAYFTGSNSGSAKPVFNNCKFIENVATSFAGAIYFDGTSSGEASPTIFNCEFIKNKSTNISEYAVFFKSDNGVCEPIISRCKFRENSANIAFEATNGSAKATVTNCAFFESESYHISFKGALPSSSPSFTNCTFASAEYGAINLVTYESGTSPLEFSNCIFNDDLFDIVGGSAGFDNSRVSVSYSMVRETSFGSINNNILGIPELYNQAKGVLIPSKCSAVIDAGDPTVILSTDVSGNPRVVGAAIDMGAYEYQSKLVYVKADAKGGNDGSSWENALTDLQDALVSPCDTSQQVWVAKGTYYPTKTGDSTITFAIPDSIQLYGGFQGNEPLGYNKNIRNFSTNESLLSGDIGVANDSTDNSIHVVSTQSVSDTTLVDGFTIAYGNARKLGPDSYGGGWVNTAISEISKTSSPVIRNCIFYQNSAGIGGAFFNGDFSSSNFKFNPLFEKCLFEGNVGKSSGGAFLNASGGPTTEANPIFNNCSFVANDGDDRAGAFYNLAQNNQASPVFNSCRFEDNIAVQGGALSMQGTNGIMKSMFTNCIFQNNGNSHIKYYDPLSGQEPSFINCTFSGASSHVIDMETWDSGMMAPEFKNCIFWNNNGDILSGSQGTDNARISVSFSDVEEAVFVPANNNLNVDPLFKNPANYDLSLKPCSPVIDQGNNSGVSATDVIGANRIFNEGTVDMGAYEFNGFYTPSGNLTLTSPVAQNADYIGNEKIIATNTVANPFKASYIAGKAVELNPGFKTESSVVFEAKIQATGCP